MEKWLPERAGNSIRANYEFDKVLEQKNIKSNVFLVFEIDRQKFEIAIVDEADDLEAVGMAHFAFEMDEEFEIVDKRENISVNTLEVHHISKEEISNKTAQILALFEDRIVVNASGDNMNAVQLWQLVKTLNIPEIIK